MDENVQSDKNVPSLERKRPRFRATGTKMSYIPIKPCQVQGRKRPRFQFPISKVRKRPRFLSARYENVPDSYQQGTKTSQIPISKDENVPYSNQQGRKRPRFRHNMFGFNAIKCDFWENMRISAVKTKICGIMQRMENYAENRKLCDIALTALKCCLWCMVTCRTVKGLKCVVNVSEANRLYVLCY